VLLVGEGRISVQLADGRGKNILLLQLEWLAHGRLVIAMRALSRLLQSSVTVH